MAVFIYRKVNNLKNTVYGMIQNEFNYVINAFGKYFRFIYHIAFEEIMLSEISQAEKDNHHMVSLIYGT